MAQLSGMKQICEYINRSECTVLTLVRTEGFPAKKIGGIWESDTQLIDDWRRENIVNGVNSPNQKNVEKQKNKKSKKARGGKWKQQID